MKWTSSLSVLLVWPWKLYYTYLAYQILKLINKCALHINNAGTFTYLSLFQAYMLLSAGTLIHALPLFNISQYIFNFLFKKLSMFIHIYPYICCFLCFLSLFHLTFHILLLNGGIHRLGSICTYVIHCHIGEWVFLECSLYDDKDVDYR